MIGNTASLSPFSTPQTWVELFEKPLGEFRLFLKQDHENFSPLDAYGCILKNYLLGRTEELSALLSVMSEYTSTHEDLAAIVELGSARLSIRRYSENPTLAQTQLQKLQNLKFNNPYLEAERHFVLAQFLEASAMYDNAARMFHVAAALFANAGCQKKACRAQLNAVANLSCLEPNKDFIAEYLAIADLALQHSESSTAAICWMNVSREYQKMNCLDVALDYCQRALQKLQNERGSLNAGLAELHKIDLLLDLKKVSQAKMMLQEIKFYTFAQIIEGAKILEAKAEDLAPSEILAQHLLPTWRERLAHMWSSLKKNDGTKLEERLISLLMEQPRDKFDLVEALYGNGGSYFMLENRLKNLLNRVRKRHPNCLKLNDDNLYTFSFHSDASQGRTL